MSPRGVTLPQLRPCWLSKGLPGRLLSPCHRRLSGQPGDVDHLIYPEAPTTNHRDLASFLAHAKRSGLGENSTVYVGTRYEYVVAEALAKYGFFLKRIGGASDYGVDLLGTWTLPSTSQTLRVLLQCKAGGGAGRVGPHYIRELEGMFAGAPAGWRGSSVLGLLVCERSATKGVRDSLSRSAWPMGYMYCERDGTVRQMLWNRSAEERGLEGYGASSRHAEGDSTAQLVLTRNGAVLPLLDSPASPPT